MEKPIITAKDEIMGREIDLKKYHFPVGVLTFRTYKSSKGLLELLSANPIRHKLLFCLSPKQEPSPIYKARVDGADIIIVINVVWGGPQTAIILEELATLGLKFVVGFGATGSLCKEITPGKIVIAQSSFCLDGTSKEYTNEEEVLADEDLLKLADKVARQNKIELIEGKGWTSDALYREYPSKIAKWKKMGANFVNMEVGPLYAVAKTLRIKAIYIATVSDYVGGKKWESWYRDLNKADSNAQKICYGIVSEICKEC